MRLLGLAQASIVGLFITFVATGAASAWDNHPETNPFPVAFGEEIPGYTKIAICSDTPEVPDNCIRRVGQPVCPPWSANDVTPTLRADGSWASAKLWCRASWTPPVTADQEAAYRKAIEDAQKAAEEESRRWNAANPGKQKCVSWGPIRHPNGVGESSGGVCANPVPAETAPSGSASVDAPSVGAGDISGSTSSSPAPGGSPSDPTPSPSAGTSTQSSSSSPTNSSSSTSQGSAPDPTPSGGVDYRGNGYPFTHIVEGQVGVSGCPVGFQAANGLIVDVSARKTYTECWPLRAWTANRLGGEAWELFKATGGTYDPTVEVERREKVALLKLKAKEVAEAAAKQTPGIERCSSWSGFGESGRECAYAFISPSSTNSPPVSVGSSSSSVSDSQAVTVIAGSSSQQVTQEAPSSSETSGAAESSVSTRSVAVGLDAVSISGTSVQIARTALTVTTDPVEAQSISSLAKNVAAVPTVIKSQTQTLPRMANLDYRVTSLTPEICRASTWRVRIPKPGLCQLEFEIVDSDGNTYEFVKKMRKQG